MVHGSEPGYTGQLVISDLTVRRMHDSERLRNRARSVIPERW
jgi:hypothetical protein